MGSETRNGLDKAQIYEAFIETSQDAFLALRHDGTIEFASAAVQALLGYEPSQVIGKNVADWLRDEDLERALVQLGESIGHLARGVTRFEVVSADGSPVPIEVAGALIRAGDRELIGLCARDGRDQAFIEAIMTKLLDGMPRHEVLVPVVNTIGWQAMGSLVAIEWVDADGRQVVKSYDFDDSLSGSEGSGDDPDAEPWSRARTSMEGQRGAVSDEGGWLRALAEGYGVDSYWVEPVEWSAEYPPATVTVWTTSEYSIDVHTYGMGVACRLVELILRWTEYVPARS